MLELLLRRTDTPGVVREQEFCLKAPCELQVLPWQPRRAVWGARRGPWRAAWTMQRMRPALAMLCGSSAAPTSAATRCAHIYLGWPVPLLKGSFAFYTPSLLAGSIIPLACK